jgi:hypothetical protein
MLGHIRPPTCRLRPTTRTEYRHLYCSMCHSLRRQFGLPASFLISHELTIGLLAHADSLAAPLEYQPCPARLYCEKRPILRHPIIDKAARMNLLLVWLKLVDWEADSRKFYSGLARRLVESRIQRFWLELSESARRFLDDYIRLIKSPNPASTEIQGGSGLLAANLLAEIVPDHDADTGAILALVGEIIPVADALLDCERDIQKGQYNPIIEASRQRAVPMAEAYGGLLQTYLDLAGQIRRRLATTDNEAFAEVLSGSLAGLSARIDQGAYWVLPPKKRDDGRRRNRRASQQRHRDRCCDCCDCCDCCPDCFSCAKSEARTGSCHACECGGCDSCDCCGGCVCGN